MKIVLFHGHELSGAGFGYPPGFPFGVPRGDIDGVPVITRQIEENVIVAVVEKSPLGERGTPVACH